MLRPVRTVAPTVDLVTLDEVKARLRITDSDQDDVIIGLIDAVTAHMDGYSGILGRCLLNQTWRQDFRFWPAGSICLPFPDVSSVTVTYFDADNAEQTLASSRYELLENARGSFVHFLDAFTAPTLYDDRSDAVQVTMVAGYGVTAASVPASIRTAAILMIGHLYEHREASTMDSLERLPMGVDSLLRPHRRVRL